MVDVNKEELRKVSPKLWIEKLWILDSMGSLIPIREISLSKGLNLVLAEPGESSSGHGVGKTAFCQLLRFVLEDPQWDQGTPLHDELRMKMPDGAVAARVHVGNECWTVLKPWQHQKRYRASLHASWQQLACNEVVNEYDQYQESLTRHLVAPLPITKFPGSSQPIKWSHILAWISRDQGSRYQSYYHWRKEGSGFSWPAQSPQTLVRILLGLLEDDTLYQQLNATKSALKALEQRKADLERRPRDLIEHVKHQLAQALGVEQDSPFFSTDMFNTDSLHGRAIQRIEQCNVELEEYKRKHAEYEAQRMKIANQMAEKKVFSEILTNQIDQYQAAIVGNLTELQRLQNEPEALLAMLDRQCEYGGCLYKDCEQVLKKIEAIDIESLRNVKSRNADVDRLKNEQRQYIERLNILEEELHPDELALADLSNQIDQLRSRELECLTQKKQLEQAVKDYDFYSTVVSNPDQWEELKKLRKEIDEQLLEKQNLEIQINQTEQAYNKRQTEISELMNEFAQFLGDKAWGVFNISNSWDHPFKVGPMHSTTYGVVETLMGDLVCLLDSSSPQSHHPGFLLHDSPREAEMNEYLFWGMLEQVIADANVHFQYIVTTSTHAPPKLRPYVRLELGSREEKDYLFRRRIWVEQESLY